MKNNISIPPKFGNIDGFKSLIETSGNIDVTGDYGFTALHQALYNKNLPLVKFLIEYGSNINKKSHEGKTPIYCAGYNGNYECIKYIIDKGADLNNIDNYGNTCLHNALSRSVIYGEDVLKYTKYLIYKGVDVNVRNNNNKTSFDLFFNNAFEGPDKKLVMNFINKYQNNVNKTLFELRLEFDELTLIMLCLKHYVNNKISKKDYNELVPDLRELLKYYII